MTLNAPYAQEHFDGFLAAVESGEELEVTRDDKPPVRLTLVPAAVEPASVDE